MLPPGVDVIPSRPGRLSPEEGLVRPSWSHKVRAVSTIDAPSPPPQSGPIKKLTHLRICRTEAREMGSS
ncbi:hypothetical protein Trco_006236 [Trichoderma cornu-damae]|uniref:Uncharacterized protein n=1 Tax=Trichoderma cornu-damae TaxID=654480 RepID=A0A9P8QGQ0_9HYPO|nr:hypothetical protein Trco_006236 [Trichoderma cornu-damae]